MRIRVRVLLTGRKYSLANHPLCYLGMRQGLLISVFASQRTRPYQVGGARPQKSLVTFNRPFVCRLGYAGKREHSARTE
jgi:hypothetical protein